MAQAQAIRASMDAAAVVLTDAQAAAAPLLYRPWDGEGAAYATGDRRLYRGYVYKCLQAHTSQSGWNPADAPSLWAQVLIPDPAVIPRVAAARQHQPLHDRRQGDTRRQNMAQHL